MALNPSGTRQVTPIDETIESAFVREMRAALDRRLACTTSDEKRRVESEMAGILRRLRAPAWKPRAEQPDRKTAAAGGE